MAPPTSRPKGQDDGAEPALADRLHLSQGHRLGLVLPQHDIGRLLALHHLLGAVDRIVIADRCIDPGKALTLKV